MNKHKHGENDKIENWNKQEESEMKKQNKLLNYGMHRIIELLKFNLESWRRRVAVSNSSC